jgi:L-amino acid N-acyltransferase YncA
MTANKKMPVYSEIAAFASGSFILISYDFTMNMHIRYATHQDLPDIVAIYNASIAGRMATADTQPVTVAARETWFRDHDPERRPLLVAEDARGIAGWLSVRSFYGRPAYHATVELGYYVAPDRRGQGVGRLLLGEALSRAPGLGVRTLLAFVFAHNAPSVGLLEAFGFARWGLLPAVAEMDGREYDVLIMGRRVVAAADRP